MKVRALLVAVGISGLIALAACDQQTTNPSGYPGSGYPGAGPVAATQELVRAAQDRVRAQ
jgi:hypothetical protein